VSRTPLPRGPRQVYARAAHFVGRRIGDEYVLVPLAGRGADLDSILNLNRVAAFVWERLDGERSVAAIAEEVARRFEVETERAETDALELVETLLGLGAIEPAGGGPGR
jgi:hypothetical protein